MRQADSEASRLNCWKTKPIRRLRTWASSSSVMALTSSPASRNEPDVGTSRQPRMCMSVDLPDPDGPMMATYSPVGDLEGHSSERLDLKRAVAVGLADISGVDDRSVGDGVYGGVIRVGSAVSSTPIGGRPGLARSVIPRNRRRRSRRRPRIRRHRHRRSRRHRRSPPLRHRRTGPGRSPPRHGRRSGSHRPCPRPRGRSSIWVFPPEAAPMVTDWGPWCHPSRTTGCVPAVVDGRGRHHDDVL